MANDRAASLNGTNRADANREMVARIHRALGRLLAQACHVEFRGSVSIEVNAKDGILAEPVAILKEHGAGK